MSGTEASPVPEVVPVTPGPTPTDMAIDDSPQASGRISPPSPLSPGTVEIDDEVIRRLKKLEDEMKAREAEKGKPKEEEEEAEKGKPKEESPLAARMRAHKADVARIKAEGEELLALAAAEAAAAAGVEPRAAEAAAAAGVDMLAEKDPWDKVSRLEVIGLTQLP